MTGFLLRGKPTVVYALSPGITMRLAIPAYSYRHGLNFILGIVKTRIGCSSGITYPSLIVMGHSLVYIACHWWYRVKWGNFGTRVISAPRFSEKLSFVNRALWSYVIGLLVEVSEKLKKNIVRIAFETPNY